MFSNRHTLIVTSSRSGNPADHRYLSESAALLDLHVTLLTGSPLPRASNDITTFMETSHAGLEAMRATDKEFVIATDAFDVLAVRWDEDELVNKIRTSDGQLLMSTEAPCFPPDAAWINKYASLSTLPWRHGNTGQYCGTKDSVIRALELMRARIHEADHGGICQEILHRMVCEGYPLSLDQSGEIFQSMYWSVSENIKWESNEVVNVLTGSRPMFLHFNGRAPGMNTWMDRLNTRQLQA